jgi:hypothetical protein
MVTLFTWLKINGLNVYRPLTKWLQLRQLVGGKRLKCLHGVTDMRDQPILSLKILLLAQTIEHCPILFDRRYGIALH